MIEDAGLTLQTLLAAKARPGQSEEFALLIEKVQGMSGSALQAELQARRMAHDGPRWSAVRRRGWSHGPGAYPGSQIPIRRSDFPDRALGSPIRRQNSPIGRPEGLSGVRIAS
jgi:hypothetical protein